MPRDQGGVSSIHASGNNHIDVSVPAVDPAVTHALAPDPLSRGLGSPGEHCQSPVDETISHGQKTFCGSPRLQQRSSSTPLEQNNMSLDALGRGRVTFWLYLHHPCPKQYSSIPREAFLASHFSCRGKWEDVNECLASPALWDTAKEAGFSLVPSRILSHELDDWEVGRDWESRT